MASYGGASVSTEELLILAGVAAVALYGVTSTVKAPLQDITRPTGQVIGSIAGILPNLLNFGEQQITSFEGWLGATF